MIDLLNSFCVDGKIFSKKQNTFLSSLRFCKTKKNLYTFLFTSPNLKMKNFLSTFFPTSRFHENEKKLTDRFDENIFNRWDKKVNQLRFAKTVSKVHILRK